MRSAGSGSFASLGHYPLDISNPRILSAMGLAIRKHYDDDDNNHNNNYHQTRGFEMSPSYYSSFENYLKVQKKRNIKQILCYAQRYCSVLETGDATPLVNLSSGAVRRHAMEALTVWSKYISHYERWQQIRKSYSLHWTSGNESLQSLQRFFNPELTLESMLDKIRKMMQVLPADMSAVIRHAVLTGLRPAEAVESVRLINDREAFAKYYDPEQMVLQHYKFPDIFLRATKKAFLSYITPDNFQPIVLLASKTPPAYRAIVRACRKAGVPCDMHLCRKLHGSWLHRYGIPSEAIEFLQGRVSPSVFSRHYLTPSQDLKDKVLDALDALKNAIETNENKKEEGGGGVVR
jgi:hypothetical protein